MPFRVNDRVKINGKHPYKGTIVAVNSMDDTKWPYIAWRYDVMPDEIPYACARGPWVVWGDEDFILLPSQEHRA